MAISRPRDRIVNFRLSAREYEAVFSAGEAMGSRSLAEFARTAVLEKAERSEDHGEVAELSMVLTKCDQIERVVRAIYDRLIAYETTSRQRPEIA
jgi:hypothetical protein